jgi:FAD/FMN-containing dehydrogenase
VLPFGLGRSYGDSCLNDGNVLLDTRALSHFISFDEQSGLLRAEAGMSLAEILETLVPRGWFLPVSPGTKFVTLGGALANDIHGKNHHRAGTFGNHVTRFGLLRSSGEYFTCSPTDHAELFRATIGGLGLTGLIVWVEIRLIPIPSPYLDTRNIKFANLDEFLAISLATDPVFDYSVAWVDCIADGPSMGRGIFMAGNFAQTRPSRKPSKLSLSIPMDAPSFVLNPFSMKAFNTIYYNLQRSKTVDALTHYEPFFYPLDSVLHWNRIYGKRGFFQYQLIVPFGDQGAALKEIFSYISRSRRASFLAVLKTFGDIESPGLLSFPRKGATLALDFPNEGRSTFKLMDDLDRIVSEAGGALYPAKDARMSPSIFEQSFPRLAEFEKWIDPRFSSSFWRRVRGNT